MRFKVTATIVREYEVDPTWYPAEQTPEEWLAIDLENYRDDPGGLLDDPFVITGEIVEQ